MQTQADPSDGRRTLVAIPEQDRANCRHYQEAAEDRLVDALLDGMPPARRPEVMAVLEELLRTFRERTEGPGVDMTAVERDSAGPVAAEPGPAGPASARRPGGSQGRRHDPR